MKRQVQPAQCVASSPEAWVQQAALYVRSGFVFISTAVIRDPVDPEVVDRKLVPLFGADANRWARVRMKKAGLARVRYLRYGRFFALFATHGKHPTFWEREGKNARDVRESPIRFFGYSISYRKGRDGKLHSSVRIERRELERLKKEWRAEFDRPLAWWRERFQNFPFEPYAPVFDQAHELRRAVNRVRAEHGLPEIPKDCVRWHRKSLKVFEEEEGGEA